MHINPVSQSKFMMLVARHQYTTPGEPVAVPLMIPRVSLHLWVSSPERQAALQSFLERLRGLTRLKISSRDRGSADVLGFLYMCGRALRGRVTRLRLVLRGDPPVGLRLMVKDYFPRL